MNHTRLIAGVATVAALGLGCSLREPTIELSASDFDLNPLVGKWSGEYISAETGRTGDISFTLKAGEAEASGAVVMAPRANTANVVSFDRPMVKGVITGESKQLLTIHFVRKEGKSVIGMLDPYVDPDCACRVTTTFKGDFVNWRTIEGTYSTISAELFHVPTQGKWKVSLVKPL